MDERNSVGVTPAGPGHSPKGGAASASPAKPSVPNAVVVHAAKPFSVYGMPVTGRQIANAIDMLANLPAWFIAMDLVPAVLPGATFHQKQEALNRLFQRWRKLGLATFMGGKWTLNYGAWNTLQASAIEARRAGTHSGSVHESAVAATSGETPTPGPAIDQDGGEG